MERLIEDKTRGGAIFSVPDNNFFVRFVSRGRKETRERERGSKSPSNFEDVQLPSARHKGGSFPLFSLTQRRTRVCFMSGENLLRRAPHIHMFSQASREKKKNLTLFFVCSRDVLLLLGRRILSQRLLQGIRVSLPAFILTISRKRHAASRPSSPPFLSIKLYVALKIPVGMRKREFSRNIISSAISPHRCLINIGWPDPVPR